MKNLLKILFILYVLSLISCGARKTEKRSEEVKEKSEIKIDSQTSDSSVLSDNTTVNNSTESTTKINDKDETITRETTYEPKDISKPAIITDEKGNKIILENVKKTTKETIQKNNKKTDNTQKSNVATNIDKNLSKKNDSKIILDGKTTSEKESDIKNSDKKTFNVFNLLWLLIPIGLLLLLYWAWKRYRSIIPI